MYRALLISLAVATASQSCHRYCTQLETPENVVAPDDCNCSTLNILQNNFKDHVADMDDTGVYFEPAKDLSQKQTITRPFHILNPIKITTKTKRSQIKTTTKETNKDLSFESVRKETVVREYLVSSKELNRAPSYYDLDIEEKERSTEDRQINLIENIESTEKTLVECLDLHLINISRKYDVTEQFKELWKERNLTVYDHLSDSGLSNMIREHCSEPEFIIEESLREIERRLSRKNKTRNNYVVNNKHVPPSTLGLSLNKDNESFSPTLSDLTVTENDSTAAYIETTESTVAHFTSTEDSTYSNDSITESSLNFTHILPMNDAVLNPMDYSNEIYNDSLIDTVHIKTDFSGSSLKSNKFQNSTTMSQEMFDLDTMPSEIFYTTYIYNTTNNVESQKTEVTLDGLVNSYHYPISNSDNETLDIDNNNYDVSTTTNSVLYTERAEAVKESKVMLTKINTKEFNNNTLKTFISSYETLPNNDFSEDNVTEPKTIIESTTSNNIISDDHYISGNLYFGSEQELVPVRLIPSQGGKCKLSINGDTLCDKLNKKTNKKSRLLMTLCDTVQSNMIQHNN